jgi:hypothetical protein
LVKAGVPARHSTSGYLLSAGCTQAKGRRRREGKRERKRRGRQKARKEMGGK